ncbi:MAG: hypothetical protein ACYSUB_02075, partial [Planctomycetota bacterium]
MYQLFQVCIVRHIIGVKPVARALGREGAGRGGKGREGAGRGGKGREGAGRGGKGREGAGRG